MSEDAVNHPRHYTTGYNTRPVECIDITRHLSFDAGNAFKYVWRAGYKTIGKEGAIEDLNKAKWYLLDIIRNRFFTENSTSEAALTAFSFVCREDADDSYDHSRYRCLQFIVKGEYDKALTCVNVMIDTVEGDVE